VENGYTKVADIEAFIASRKDEKDSLVESQKKDKKASFAIYSICRENDI